jgi:hypothetical protein
VLSCKRCEENKFYLSHKTARNVGGTMKGNLVIDFGRNEIFLILTFIGTELKANPLGY